MKFGVYSIVVPDYPPEEAAKLIKEVGYTGVEWTVGYQKAVYDPQKEWHLSWKDCDEELPRIKEITEKYDLEVPSLGTGAATDDFSKIEKIFKIASYLGSPCARIGSARYDGRADYNDLFKKVVKDYRTIEKMAQEHGAKALIEIHGGTIAPSPSAAYRIVSNFDPQYVGVTLDPGNMVREGMETWKMGIEILGDYLAHVHVKNLGWFYEEGEGWKTANTSLDKGIADWREIVAVLRKRGYEGYLDIEDFRGGYCVKPVGITSEQKLREDKAFLDGCLSSA